MEEDLAVYGQILWFWMSLTRHQYQTMTGATRQKLVGSSANRQGRQKGQGMPLLL